MLEARVNRLHETVDTPEAAGSLEETAKNLGQKKTGKTCRKS